MPKPNDPDVNRVLMLPPFAVLKRYPANWRATTEAAALRAVRHTGLAPKLLGHADQRGTAWALASYRRGRPASSHRAADISACLATLSRVHEIPGIAFGRLHAPQFADWHDCLAERLYAYRLEFRACGMADAVLFCDRIEASLHLLPEPRPVLLHGDPRPANFLIRRDRAVLLDWELASYGDPTQDLVRFAWDWRLPDSAWRSTVGIDPDDPAVATYRRIHLVSRLMSASGRVSDASSALADRCRAEIAADELLGSEPRTGR